MCIYKVPPGEGGWRYPCGKMDRTSKESLGDGGCRGSGSLPRQGETGMVVLEHGL